MTTWADRGCAVLRCARRGAWRLAIASAVPATPPAPTGIDTDDDELLDGAELTTSPLLAGSDGGSTDDGTEIGGGSDPLDPTDD